MRNGFDFGISGLIAGTMFAASLAATPALAQGLTHAQGQSTSNCTCRYRGQDFQLGDRVCLNSPDGPQQAECGFVLNNTSWNFTGLSCVYSSTFGPGRLASLTETIMSPVTFAAME